LNRRIRDDPPYLGFGSCGLDRLTRDGQPYQRMGIISCSWDASPRYTDRPPHLEIFAGVEEVARVEGAFDLGVEMTEGGSGGYFPPRFFSEADAVFTADDAAHL